MAEKDYAAKKHAPKRKTPSNTKKNNQNNLICYLAILIIILFITILYFIVINKPDAKKTSREPRHHAQTKRENTLPPKPEERWHYIKELENQSTEVNSPPNNQQPTINANRPLTPEQRQILESFQQNESATQPEKKPIIKQVEQNYAVRANSKPTATQITNIGKWYIQCGSFKTKSSAEAVKIKLAFSGINSRISSSGDWHRVIFGNYNTKQDANNGLNRLKKANFNSCLVLSGG